jgi:hypothetical protein
MTMRSKLAIGIATIVTAVSLDSLTADVLEKLPRKVRLQFLQSLVVVDGHPAGARIDQVKKSLTGAEWKEFKAMFGWVASDHEGYSCIQGECKTWQGSICAPEYCHGGCLPLGNVLASAPQGARDDFLMALKFRDGRAVKPPLEKVRRHLKPAEAAELEKMLGEQR